MTAILTVNVRQPLPGYIDISDDTEADAMRPNDRTSERKAATSRRTFLRAVGFGSGVTALGVGTAAANAPLDDQLEQVRDATAKYENPQAAIDDGFQVMGPYVPGMGWHFLNLDNLGAAIENDFDIETPQLLTYGDAGNGFENLTLASVEYAIPMGHGSTRLRTRRTCSRTPTAWRSGTPIRRRNTR